MFTLPTKLAIPTKSYINRFNVCITNMEAKQLLDHTKIIFNSADLVYSNKDYTSATILYFKTLFSIFDFILLQTQGKVPKDHTERFRMLERHNPDIYEFLDKYFKIYRDTYTISIDRETCNEIRENIKRIIKKYNIQI